MDTKWKSSKSIRIAVTVVVLLLLTAANVCSFPAINAKVQQVMENKDGETDTYINEYVLSRIYDGCSVLYWEIMESSTEEQENMEDLFIQASEEEKENVRFVFDEIRERFESVRNDIDFYAMIGTGAATTNTSEALDMLNSKVMPDADRINKLSEKYQCLFQLRFDENGALSIRIYKSGAVSQDNLLKKIQMLSRNNDLAERVRQEYGDTYQIKKITDFSVVFGIPQNLQLGLFTTPNTNLWDVLLEHSMVGYELSCLFLIIFVFVMTSNWVWKGTVSYTRQGGQYFLELAVVGACFLVGFINLQVECIYMLQSKDIVDILSMPTYATSEQWGYLLSSYLIMLGIYTCNYLTLLYIRPVFSLGVKRYIQEYSFLYLLWQKIVAVYRSFMKRILTVDLSKKSNKTIIKLLGVNFVILAVLMCMWTFGILGLVIYTVILFFTMHKYYEKIVADFQKLLADTRSIARGEYLADEEQDYGLFQTMGNELGRIQEDFEEALNREIKSERLKSELITNVSHDLKTPLTAITTYIALLKKPDITEEERNSYIDTMDEKSQRLKALIEDLFEISKASSNNIVLHYVDVDVVNLLKQIYVEHEENFQDMGLVVKWKVPEERIILLLDSQKTYRVFDNLFSNIQKYAMHGSRVYIQVEKLRTRLAVSIKNISATELDVKPEELTERFVRGDSSRNTEGSGLGLAIAKSFVEAQKGSCDIMIDGDLFKVMIQFDLKEDEEKRGEVIAFSE